MVAFFRGLNIVDLTEIFSPPRIAKQCDRYGLKAGSSMDLMTGWNFDLEADRERAKKKIREEKPMLLVGSPPCTFFSTLQELNKFNMRDDPAWIAKFNANLEKAVRHNILRGTL